VIDKTIMAKSIDKAIFFKDYKLKQLFQDIPIKLG